jgi:hypothetical protein
MAMFRHLEADETVGWVERSETQRFRAGLKPAPTRDRMCRFVPRRDHFILWIMMGAMAAGRPCVMAGCEMMMSGRRMRRPQTPYPHEEEDEACLIHTFPLHPSTFITHHSSFS